MRFSLLRFLAALTLCAFFLPLSALAADVNTTIGIPIEIQTIPEVPSPGASVVLQAQNVPNKDTAVYTWTVDGRLVEQGIGRDSLSVTAGSVGERTTVSVSISVDGVVVGSKTRTILPGELDLTWEANTYVPPLYIGRPLATGDSTITVLAVPNVVVNGARVSADALVYKWYVNGAQTPYRTGYGLSSISLTPPLFNSAFSVRAIATTKDGAVSVQQQTAIVPQSPELVYYQKHPLLGTLFNKALGEGGFSLTEDEVTLRLFPFFVLNPNKATYTWTVAGNSVNPDSGGRELTLRKTGSGSGNFVIKTSVQTSGSLYESAEAGTRLTF